MLKVSPLTYPHVASHFIERSNAFAHKATRKHHSHRQRHGFVLNIAPVSTADTKTCVRCVCVCVLNSPKIKRNGSVFMLFVWEYHTGILVYTHTHINTHSTHAWKSSMLQSFGRANIEFAYVSIIRGFYTRTQMPINM